VTLSVQSLAQIVKKPRTGLTQEECQKARKFCLGAFARSPDHTVVIRRRIGLRNEKCECRDSQIHNRHKHKDPMPAAGMIFDDTC
jgi:hypothetical protein